MAGQSNCCHRERIDKKKVVAQIVDLLKLLDETSHEPNEPELFANSFPAASTPNPDTPPSTLPSAATPLDKEEAAAVDDDDDIQIIEVPPKEIEVIELSDDDDNEATSSSLPPMVSSEKEEMMPVLQEGGKIPPERCSPAHLARNPTQSHFNQPGVTRTSNDARPKEHQQESYSEGLQKLLLKVLNMAACKTIAKKSNSDSSKNKEMEPILIEDDPCDVIDTHPSPPLPSESAAVGHCMVPLNEIPLPPPKEIATTENEDNSSGYMSSSTSSAVEIIEEKKTEKKVIQNPEKRKVKKKTKTNFFTNCSICPKPNPKWASIPSQEILKHNIVEFQKKRMERKRSSPINMDNSASRVNNLRKLEAKYDVAIEPMEDESSSSEDDVFIYPMAAYEALSKRQRL